MGNIVWRSQAAIDAEREAQAWASLRAERDRRLRDCDWIMLPDAPVPEGTTIEQWKTYRQSLRDVPQQPGAPDDVTWPLPPNWDDAK